MPADNAKATLVEDRRRLLEHALQVFQKHGGRVQLPIGMAAAEPWLLDSVDVGALLTALSAASGSTALNIDLLAYCQRGARTATAGSKAHSRVSSRRTSEAAGQDVTAPQLQLPQLEAGLSEGEVKDLAYLVFACNCPHEADLLDSVRSQLDIDESRAAEVQRLLGLVHAAMRQQAGPLLMSKSWTASLQLPVCMLGLVLPRDFTRFRSFVMWRDTLSHVLLATLAQSVKEGWCQDMLQQPQHHKQQQQAQKHQPLEQQLQPQGSGGGTAQQLMARLKAALRRLDVREADDFDEEEYRAASEAVRQQTQAIVECTPAGWAFPWCLRVRVYEVLLRAVFDSLDEAEYVPDKDRYLQLLESRVRPLLGIAEPMHAAVLAWVHFRQYVITQAPQLLSETRGLLYKLASIAAGSAEQGAGEKPAATAAAAAAAASLGASILSGTSAASPCIPSSQPAARSASAAAGGSGGGVYMQQDTAFARGVGQAVVDWILERLSDYHGRLDALGGPESVAGLVDLLVFASASRGATEEEIGRALLEAVSLSVSAELQRRMDAAAAAAARASSTADDAEDADGRASEALRCADVCKTARGLLSEEYVWTRGFASQLPEAFPVALSVLQEAAGSVLLPWLATQPVLDEEACEALRCALKLEPRLMGPIRTAATSSCRFRCTARLFASVKPWNMPAQLQPLLSAWLEKQMSGFIMWVDRQLQQEDWRPLGLEQAHSASARELRRIALEALEALFGLQLPLPAATVRQYMQGIAGMMTRYLDAILSTLGSETVMIPPTPHLTRYKREVAVKQEEAESQLPGMPTQQPPANAVSRKGTHFADSVRRIEDEPCASRVGGLTTPVLVVMMASLAYLVQTLQLLSASVKQLRQQEQQARLSGSGSPAHLDPFDSRTDAAATAAAVSGFNPFTSDGEAHVLQSPDPGGNVNSSYRSPWSEGGGSIGSPMWGPNRPPLQQQQQQQQLSGMQWRSPGCAAEGSGGGSLGPGSGAGSEGYGLRDEQLGSLHETGQKLRAGLASVSRWLAVRVVWWEQRAAWCELLYRHRVMSCRLDWLLDALADTLQDHISVLPREPQDLYGGVALELLQQAAKALERALLDGGPCRWFIPADVEHLRDDVEELRKLFFRAKVPMQDIRTALLGLEGVLKLMAKQTGPLIDGHRAARRAALLAGPAAPSTPPTAPFSATAAAGQPGMYSPVSAAAGSSGGGQHSRSPSHGTAASIGTQALGPLAAAKLANAAAGQGPSGATVGGRPSDRGSGSGGGGFVHHSRQATGGSSGGGGAFDDAASYSSYNSSSPSWTAAKGAAGGAAAGLGGGAGTGSGAAGMIGGVGCMRRTAQDVAATGGDVELQEPILLRVLCHRADHTASKYLKDNVKVSKVKDESSVKETLKRGVTRFNPF